MSDNTPSGPPQDENDPYAAQPPANQNPDVPPAPGPDVPPAPAPGPPPASPYGQPAPGAPQYEQPQYGAPGQPPYNQPPYGAPGQPPYGQQPYGSVPGQQVQIGEAFSYGWLKFQQNIGPIILGVLTYTIIPVILTFIWIAGLTAGASTATVDPVTGQIRGGGGLLAGFGFGTFLLVAAITILAFLAQAAVVRVSLLLAEGRKLEYRDFFQFPNLGNVVLTALLIALATGILSFTVIGGIIFAFFATFALFFVIDRNLGAIDGIKASFSLVNKNLGTVVVLFIAVYVAQSIGMLLCGIGLLVAMPVSLIATAYVYKRLTNEPIAA